MSNCQNNSDYKDHNTMINNPIVVDHLDTTARSAEQGATSRHHSIFNCKAFGINNSGEVIDKHKAPKLESKQLTSYTRVEIIAICQCGRNKTKLICMEMKRQNCITNSSKKTTVCGVQ
jgi:hypothetical protein